MSSKNTLKVSLRKNHIEKGKFDDGVIGVFWYDQNAGFFLKTQSQNTNIQIQVC
jgi:hypothetical protein